VIFLDAAFNWPETAGGWVALLLAVVTIISIVGGVIVRLGRNHVDNRIRVDMKEEIKGSVEECVAPLVVSINTLVGYRREDMAARDSDRKAINEANSRIVSLESTINNGLTHATEKTASDVEAMKIQLAEMHGWMKATHNKNWDGEDRRSA
jgi:chromosome segregation ATPase